MAHRLNGALAAGSAVTVPDIMILPLSYACERTAS
jgi:hypothetical protein